MSITPPGVRGLILAGILATILSTLDSYLFNAATCVSYDLFNKKVQFKPWHHHLALIAVAILSLFLSMQFSGSVVEVWKTMGGFSAACLLFPFMCSQIFPRRLSENSFIGAVLTGMIFMVIWGVFSISQYVYGIDKFYAGLLGTSLVMIPALLRGQKA
jgi:SSS family solute:Na+ symporter